SGARRCRRRTPRRLPSLAGDPGARTPHGPRGPQQRETDAEVGDLPRLSGKEGQVPGDGRVRESLMKSLKILSLTAALLASSAAMAADLRIALQDDPDVLDPHMARTFVGRIVFTSLCDKLVDIN